MNVHTGPARHDPIATSLSKADDRILLSHWLPPQEGIVPRIRFRERWYNVLWALPIAFVLLVAGVALAQALRQMPEVQAFLARYPGAPASVAPITSGFPFWLRAQHFLNLLFMAFIIRSRAATKWVRNEGVQLWTRGHVHRLVWRMTHP